MKPKMSQESVKIGLGTCQEQNPRELPSGFELQGRRVSNLRALSRVAGGSGGPGLSSFLRKNITRKKILPTILNTPMTHQGGLADLEASATAADPSSFNVTCRPVGKDQAASRFCRLALPKEILGAYGNPRGNMLLLFFSGVCISQCLSTSSRITCKSTLSELGKDSPRLTGTLSNLR